MPRTGFMCLNMEVDTESGSSGKCLCDTVPTLTSDTWQFTATGVIDGHERLRLTKALQARIRMKCLSACETQDAPQHGQLHLLSYLKAVTCTDAYLKRTILADSSDEVDAAYANDRNLSRTSFQLQGQNMHSKEKKQVCCVKVSWRT